MRILTLAALLVGCGAGKLEGDDAAGDDTGDPADTDADTTGGYVAGESPTVEGVRSADCGANQQDIEIWGVEITVSDPQGVETIDGATVTVLDGETELATYSLACNEDACSGIWLETDDDIDCATGSASTFRFLAVDRDGNPSRPFDHDPD